MMTHQTAEPTEIDDNGSRSFLVEFSTPAKRQCRLYRSEGPSLDNFERVRDNEPVSLVSNRSRSPNVPPAHFVFAVDVDTDQCELFVIERP